MGAVVITEKQEVPDLHPILQDYGRGVIAKVAMSSSYSTGGDTVSLNTLGLSRVKAMLVYSTNRTPLRFSGAIVTQPTGLGLVLGGTEVAPTIVAYRSADATPQTAVQVAAAVNLSTTTAYVLFIGE
jgi:hypothetical protein